MGCKHWLFRFQYPPPLLSLFVVSAILFLSRLQLFCITLKLKFCLLCVAGLWMYCFCKDRLLTAQKYIYEQEQIFIYGTNVGKHIVVQRNVVSFRQIFQGLLSPRKHLGNVAKCSRITIYVDNQVTLRTLNGHVF